MEKVSPENYFTIKDQIWQHGEVRVIKAQPSFSAVTQK